MKFGGDILEITWSHPTLGTGVIYPKPIPILNFKFIKRIKPYRLPRKLKKFYKKCKNIRLNIPGKNEKILNWFSFKKLLFYNKLFPIIKNKIYGGSI